MKNISIILRQDQEKILPIIHTKGSENYKISVKLAGRGAKLTLLGAFKLSDEDQVKVNITIDHQVPDTVSDTLIKASLADKSVGSFFGLVKIKKGAKNTNTYFREDALLLSDTAKATAVPSLEIDENEIKAGHASSVGPLDPEQLFYLQSRGINKTEAREIITKGFFAPVLEKLAEKNKRRFLND